MRPILSNPDILYVADVREMEFDFKTHLVVTSPPYYNIKDYGDIQLGYGQKYSEYVDDLCDTMSKCANTLHSGCRMCINIGDRYLSSEEYGRFRVLPIPAHLVIRVQKMGLDYMGNIVWSKKGNCNPSGGGSWMGSTYYPKDGQLFHDYEWILLFRKHGEWKKPSKEVKIKSRLTKKQRSRWFQAVWDDVPPVRQIKHPAAFPVRLPTRLIRMFSFWGETVLDPFMGSGTSFVAAKNTERKCIGVEANWPFVEVTKERCSWVEVRNEPA